jgi:hypothetical protein
MNGAKSSPDVFAGPEPALRSQGGEIRGQMSDLDDRLERLADLVGQLRERTAAVCAPTPTAGERPEDDRFDGNTEIGQWISRHVRKVESIHGVVAEILTTIEL